MKLRAALLFLLLCFSEIAFSQSDSSRPVHIGFCYPLSTNGTDAPYITNGASFHAIAGVSFAEASFCLSGVVSSVRSDARGLLLSGVLSITGGGMNGCMISGCTGIVRGSVKGLQLSGCNGIAGSVSGCQLSGFSGVVKDSLTGAQVSGFASISRYAENQVSGFCNVARSVSGIQLAGFANVAGALSGMQCAGFINTAKEISGVQLSGFINIADKVKGAQIAGFINIADSCEYPVGLINIIRSGELWLGAEADETGSALLAFRSGSSHLYGILAAGVNNTGNKLRYALEGGLGLNTFSTKHFRLKTELTVTSVTAFDDGVYMRSALRMLPAVRFGDRIELYGGISGCFINTPQRDALLPDLPYLWEHRRNGTFYGIALGAVAGIQVRL
ncbi:hypothetical protein [Rurimicrobium arvi]